MAADMTNKYSKNFITKLLIVFVLLSTISLLLGCSSGKPHNISRKHYQYALKAIDIADAYLDEEISVSEAAELMNELQEQEIDLPIADPKKPSQVYNASIELAVLILSTDLDMATNSTTQPYENILTWRNNLAETIGEKAR